MPYSGEGMTPAESRTCYDEADNCPEADCDNPTHMKSCKKSCKKCDGQSMSAEDKDEDKDEVEPKSMSLEEIVFDDTTTTTTTTTPSTTTATDTDSNDQKEDEDETAPEVKFLQKEKEDLGEFDEGIEGEDSDLWKESDGVLLPNVFSIDLGD